MDTDKLDSFDWCFDLFYDLESILWRTLVPKREVNDFTVVLKTA